MKNVHADVQDPGGTCDQCGESFATTHGASVHRREHSGEKPYHCRLCDVQDPGGTFDQCGRSFATMQGASAPKRVHSGEKPYRCCLCGEGFISSDHLKQHMKTHANELACARAHREQTFVQRKLLVAHSWKVHGSKLVDEEISKKDQVDPSASNQLRKIMKTEPLGIIFKLD